MTLKTFFYRVTPIVCSVGASVWTTSVLLIKRLVGTVARNKCCSLLVIVLSLNVGPIVIAKLRSIRSTGIAQTQRSLVPVGNTNNVNRRGDVVFVHGLGGDGTSTWTSADGSFYWPKELGDDLKDVGVWVVNYEAQPMDWLGPTMPIERRAIHLLESLKNAKLGERRIIFVSHSLGGIVVKQMIQDSRDLGIPEYKDISLRTRGVVFLGTPNTGSSVATLGKTLKDIGFSLGANVTEEQLANNAPVLLRLNAWYRNNSVIMEIKTKAFSEEKDTYGVRIVDEASAEPGMSGISAVPLPEDHLSICKPNSRDSDAYKSVLQFIDQEAIPLPGAYSKDFPGFLGEFNQAKGDAAELDRFLADHAGQEVNWEAVIVGKSSDIKESHYTIAVPGDNDPMNQVIAGFQYWNVKEEMVLGAKLRIRGLISKKSNRLGAILKECRVPDK